MCTLLLLHQVIPAVPLVVLANRDEMLARPSLGPRLVRREVRVFCGVDAKEGGTWCGINDRGLFVGLTNLSVREPDPARRSRGLLCLDMLAQASFDEVRRSVESIGTDVYNPFNLVVSDGQRALRVRYDGRATVEMLGAGVHATTNWPRGSGGDAKRVGAEAQAARVAGAHGDLRGVLDGLARVAATHERGGDPRASICCHAPGYGTRSATLIAVTASGEAVYWYSDGPPCEAPFEDKTPLMRAQFAR